MCASLPTGTSLNARGGQDDDRNAHISPVSTHGLANISTTAPPSVLSNTAETPVVNDASDANLLTLNATGELRYLGASSGAFFASCAAAFVRSSGSDSQSRTTAQGSAGRPPARITSPPDAPINLSWDEILLLLKSFEMWVHPLYPLMDPGALRDLVARHKNELSKDAPDGNILSSLQRVEITIVLVVLALGATNRSNTLKQLHLTADDLLYRIPSTPAPSAESLCAAALRHLRSCQDTIQSSVQYVQMLLLFCIYSSYGPVGSSQWQLAGLAIRVSLSNLPLHLRTYVH